MRLVAGGDRTQWIVSTEAGRGRLGGVDGSVCEGARRGYNPHRRKVPRHYPITVYEANTGQVLRVSIREGGVHDGKGSLVFLGELFQ